MDDFGVLAAPAEAPIEAFESGLAGLEFDRAAVHAGWWTWATTWGRGLSRGGSDCPGSAVAGGVVDEQEPGVDGLRGV